MESFLTINSVYVILGSIFLGATAGMLGVFGVLRKQGLLGDALAHAALPGIALAFLIMGERVLSGMLLGALISGLLGAYFIYYLVRNTKIKMDSAMASVLSVFFGFGIVLLTYIQDLPSAAKAGLDTFLFGQAAALLRIDVVLMAIVFVLTLVMVTVFWKELKVFVFDEKFAKVIGFNSRWFEVMFMTLYVMAILVSLQAVGVVLTAALFITPAASALLWSQRLITAVVLSTLFGAFVGASGAYVSTVMVNMPTGPVIVMIASLIFIVTFLFSSRNGILWKTLEKRRYSKKVQMENLLGRLYRDYEGGVEVLTVSYFVDYGYRKSDLYALKRAGFVSVKNEEVTLTKAGLKSAFGVIEKHRLWETYLVERMNLASDHVHRDAEIMEHLLTEDITDQLKRILKNPKSDPHGKSLKIK